MGIHHNIKPYGVVGMQYTKPMIELVFEIRRYTPSDLKPSIKLANPELFDELHKYYYQGASAASKALIKELFFLAGDEWHERLKTESDLPKQSFRAYRGLMGLTDKPSVDELEEETTTKARRKRVYRGQAIED